MSLNSKDRIESKYALVTSFCKPVVINFFSISGISIRYCASRVKDDFQILKQVLMQELLRFEIMLYTSRATNEQRFVSLFRDVPSTLLISYNIDNL